MSVTHIEQITHLAKYTYLEVLHTLMLLVWGSDTWESIQTIQSIHTVCIKVFRFVNKYQNSALMLIP